LRHPETRRLTCQHGRILIEQGRYVEAEYVARVAVKEYLSNENISTDNEFVIAGYNPPWIPGFLARNEVMIKIKE